MKSSSINYCTRIIIESLLIKSFKKCFNIYNIKLFYTFNEEKSSIIKRFNKTSLTKNYKYILKSATNHKLVDSMIEQIIAKYNFNNVCRIIDMKLY